MTVSVAQFKARIDEQILTQLTDYNNVTVDEVKLECALADAGGQIEGWLFKLPTADRPPSTTLDVYQVALALSILVGNRPGVEFDSIRSRAQDAVKYFEGLLGRQSVSIDVETSGPTALMAATDLTLFGGGAGGTT